MLIKVTNKQHTVESLRNTGNSYQKPILLMTITPL